MNIVILLKHKENNIEREDMFINGKYIMQNNQDIINNLYDTIIEKVNLDDYMTRIEKNNFFYNDNCKILRSEQDAILNGEIDYAFDMIKARLENEAANDHLLRCISAELDRYQDMTLEVLNYILKHLDSKEVNEIYNIIKRWAC